MKTVTFHNVTISIPLEGEYPLTVQEAYDHLTHILSEQEFEVATDTYSVDDGEEVSTTELIRNCNY